ncbi:hypothetical protein SKAU_G00107780 [Synaphobranchus kaupii]|uniref:Uncharacterized protein n=1 Tax=Synaphobranchus kaupii TaxID=118154 RepID=A0A9Q1G0M9_SYNKA|nr:hypothetical protein SKAU_G00107780 [Synaphobranchus kaupii]
MGCWEMNDLVNRVQLSAGRLSMPQLPRSNLAPSAPSQGSAGGRGNRALNSAALLPSAPSPPPWPSFTHELLAITQRASVHPRRMRYRAATRDTPRALKNSFTAPNTHNVQHAESRK